MNNCAHVHIAIDTHGLAEYGQLIMDTIPFMNGWKGSPNVHSAMELSGRYFIFDFEDKFFSWSHFNESPPEDYLVIRSLSHLTDLLEYINAVGDTFVGASCIKIKFDKLLIPKMSEKLFPSGTMWGNPPYPIAPTPVEPADKSWTSWGTDAEMAYLKVSPEVLQYYSSLYEELMKKELGTLSK